MKRLLTLSLAALLAAGLTACGAAEEPQRNESGTEETGVSRIIKKERDIKCFMLKGNKTYFLTVSFLHSYSCLLSVKYSKKDKKHGL